MKTFELTEYPLIFADDTKAFYTRELEIKNKKLEKLNKELREAYEDAYNTTEKFIYLFEFAPIGYFALDKYANIREVNYKAAKMLNKELNELKNQNILNYISADSASDFTGFMKQLFSNTRINRCEIWLETGTESRICVSIKGVLSGNLQNCLIIATDITRRKNAEQALEEREKRLKELNATKNKFLSIISHDLRSPISSIIGLSNLLKQKVKQGDCSEAYEYARYIKESSLKAIELLNNLTEWSAAQSGKIKYSPTHNDLKKQVNNSVELCQDPARQKNIRIDTEVSPGICVFADKDMVNIIIRNLLCNAVKFTSAGGNIKISGEKRVHDVLIKVSDTGVGISKERQKKLFDAEENVSTPGTMNEKGTGLGLNLVKEFVKRQKGEIWVESETGKGSTFFVSLPQC